MLLVKDYSAILFAVVGLFFIFTLVTSLAAAPLRLADFNEILLLLKQQVLWLWGLVLMEPKSM